VRSPSPHFSKALLPSSATIRLISVAKRKKRKRRRHGCGTFCQQAGPGAGGGPIAGVGDYPAPLTASTAPMTMISGVVRVRIRCRLTRKMTLVYVGTMLETGCVGAVLILDGYPRDIWGAVGRADVKVPT